MIVTVLISVALLILLIAGMVQQERVRLWGEHQQWLAEKQRAEIERQKQEAANRIKEMLRERRNSSGEVASADQFVADAVSAAETASGRSAERVAARQTARAAADGEQQTEVWPSSAG